MTAVQPTFGLAYQPRPAVTRSGAQGVTSGAAGNRPFDRFEIQPAEIQTAEINTARNAEVDGVEASPRKSGGLLGGTAKAFKYGALANLITIPLAAVQFMLAPFSAGISLLTGLKTLILGPMIAATVGFVKGAFSKK